MIIKEFFNVYLKCGIGMNEFDYRILALLKQQRERPERPERGFEP